MTPLTAPRQALAPVTLVTLSQVSQSPVAPVTLVTLVTLSQVPQAPVAPVTLVTLVTLSQVPQAPVAPVTLVTLNPKPQLAPATPATTFPTLAATYSEAAVALASQLRYVPVTSNTSDLRPLTSDLLFPLPILSV